MGHDKIGPKEAQLRALRRVAKNKELIDKTAATKVKAKAVGKVVTVKVKRRTR
jgi:hypothetical protein